METLINMVICDKQVENFKIFAIQEGIKRILRDIRYDLDDIVVILNRVEWFMVSNLERDSNDLQDEVAVINVPPLNTVHANYSSHSPIIILD